MTTTFRFAVSSAASLLFATAAAVAPDARAADDVIAPAPGMVGLSPEGSRSPWGIGLGVGAQRQPYAGIGTETRVVPLILYENRYVRLRGLGADLKLPTPGPVSLALRVRYAPDGYDGSDAPVLNGMADRKAAVLLGGAAAWRSGFGVLSAEVAGDVSGHSKGQQVRLGFDKPIRLGAFMVTPRVAAVWLDRRTVDYYYGVRAAEALPGRPQYDGSSTTNAELGLRTDYAITRNHLVTLDAGMTFLGRAIKDSPLVDRTTQTGIRLGYIYLF
ncbi:MAG: MipA/OmpV family protein [Pseudomonadota bacterium]